MSSQASSNAQQADSLDLETETADNGQDISAGANDFATALAKLAQDDEDTDDGDGVDDNGTPRESGKKVKLDSLDSLAASLGIEVKDLYGIKVPGSGGREAMTIGQIKDRFTSFDSLESDRLALTERQVQQEAEFEQTRAELRELLAVVPKEHLSQEKLQAAAQRVAARNKADGKRLLDAMPEWRDQERREAEATDMAASLGKYGIPASYLGTIRNPALLKFIRDAARREKQVQAALAAVKKIPRKKVAATATGRTPPRIQSQQQQQRNPNAPERPTTDRERFSAALKSAT
jgi:hypothetical protein